MTWRLEVKRVWKIAGDVTRTEQENWVEVDIGETDETGSLG
jgi:hypothetical protein